ncbi:unnamed protein product [Discosporangium mesarthrocarpum]
MELWGTRFIFSGSLSPKQAKRLIKMQGLYAVVANDTAGPMALSSAFKEERERLVCKGLSKVSRSRQRYLLEQGGKDSSTNARGPVGNLVERLGVFLRVSAEEDADEVAAKIKEIEDGCNGLSIEGLWAGSEDPEVCRNLLHKVRLKTDLGSLKVVLEHTGARSDRWYKGLRGEERGPIMWFFEFEM